MKRYLVAYDGSPQAESALKYAGLLSQYVSGMLDVVFIADLRVLSNPLFDITLLALQGLGTLGNVIPREQAMLQLKTKLIARGEELLEEAKKHAEVQAAPAVHTRVEAANPPEFLIENSPFCDILFLGLRGEMHQYKAGMWGSTAETVIRRGESPVFLATGDYKPFVRLIVGFDNKPRSRQALAWAGVIASSMDLPMTVVIAGSDDRVREEIQNEALRIASAYDANPATVSTDEPAAKAILRAAGETGDALICMGAFGDQPIREFFLGSVAEEVLRKTSSPVFLLK